MPSRMGTFFVHGEQDLNRIAARRGSRPCRRDSRASHPAQSLTLSTITWDERPWTDVLDRLDRIGMTLLPKAKHHSDGTFIVSRWLTSSGLRRLADSLVTMPHPVMLCTAAPSVLCAQALRLGVADIVRADMNMSEILARIALRCGRDKGTQLAFGPLLLDRMQRLAWCDGRMLRITPLQFDLLAALMAAGGTMLSAEALRHAVWHNARDTGTNRLAVHIYHLRRALEDAGGGVAVHSAVGGYALFFQQPA